jgi:hypothetical protein
MAKETKTNLPLNNDGVSPGQESILNQDHINYDPIKIYSERAPYTKESKPHEVFGPKNQAIVETLIKQWAKSYDTLIGLGKKEEASLFETGIKKAHTQLSHLSNLKDEWMTMRGGGMRGKSTVSNITDTRWPDEFFTEKGDIYIAPDGFEVFAHVPSLGGPPKPIEDIALDWESKGDGEGRYMAAIQDMQEAGARGDKIPPFDVDYFTSNLLEEYWPQALSDKWGGTYALHTIMPEMVRENNGTIEGLNLSIEAFNPENDLRLHRYYSDRLRKAFNPEYAGTFEELEQENKQQTKENLPKDDLLINRVNADILSDRTYKAIKHARTHGKI